MPTEPDKASDNPYEAPRELDNRAIATNGIRLSCRQLLELRSTGPTVWYYFRRVWIRYLVFTTTYALGAAYLWYVVEWRFMAVAMAGFCIGRTVRDVRWWFALSSQWNTTRELLDWPKIESIANEE